MSFLVIAALTLLVYYPSLWHAPRSDQIVYFFVTAPWHDWSRLTIPCYDLNRWGIFAAGDEKLFRPLVFLFLGTEKYFFGYNFWAWQAVGIILHLAVIGFLMKMLWRLGSSRVAFVSSLFFALLLMNMEMVIWSHIHSYLIFVLALLIALDQIYLFIVEDKQDRWRWALVGTCFLVAGFIYETANIFAVLSFLFLFKKKHSWTLLIPFGLYLVLDGINAMGHHITQTIPPLNLLQGLIHTVLACGFWLYSGLWPAAVQLYFDGRNMIKEESLNDLLSYLAAIAAGVSIAMGLKRLERPHRKFLFLLLAMVLAYALVIVMGRGQVYSVHQTLIRNTHYYYSFWALTIMATGVLLSTLKNQMLKTVFVTALVGLSLINGVKLYQINDLQAKGSQATIVLARAVELLVQEKKDQKDFSFYVPPDYPGNYAYQDAYGRKSSFIGMLYPQYYTTRHPKYKFLVHPHGS